MLRGFALLFCALVVCGCSMQPQTPSGTAQPPPQTPSGTAQPPPQTPSGTAQPDPSRLALRGHLYDQDSRLAAAEEVLVDDCMKVRSEDYVPVPPPNPNWGIYLSPLKDGSLTDAREWGFGLSRQPLPPGDPNKNYQARLSERAQRD